MPLVLRMTLAREHVKMRGGERDKWFVVEMLHMLPKIKCAYNLNDIFICISSGLLKNKN